MGIGQNLTIGIDNESRSGTASTRLEAVQMVPAEKSPQERIIKSSGCLTGYCPGSINSNNRRPTF